MKNKGKHPIRQPPRPAEPYESDWDHIFDELRRMDLLLRWQIEKQQHFRPDSRLSEFRGLVLTEEDISCLLVDDDCSKRSSCGDENLGDDEQAADRLASHIDALDRLIADRIESSRKSGVTLSLPRLAKLFELDKFEQLCLLICLAPEVDSKYEKIYAFIQDDVTKKRPTVDLILQLICPDVVDRCKARHYFGSKGRLVRHGLLKIGDPSTYGSTPLLSQYVKLDNRIVDYLFGVKGLDAGLELLAILAPPCIGEWHSPANVERADRIINLLRSSQLDQEGGTDSESAVFCFHGSYGSGRLNVARRVCRELGLNLIVAETRKIFDGRQSFEQMMCLLAREARLSSAALYLQGFTFLAGGNADADRNLGSALCAIAAVKEISKITFLASEVPWKPQGLLGKTFFVNIDFEELGYADRRLLWGHYLAGQNALSDSIDPGEFGSKLRLTEGQIKDAVQQARHHALWRSPEQPTIMLSDLSIACRDQANQRLANLAQKIKPKHVWDDLVLDPDQNRQLREMCMQVRLRHIVHGEWGFDNKLSLGRGINVLFSGPPGTGKTTAAEVIAEELNLDLYKINLSSVVSKYIGETSENLNNIFNEAQTSNAILLFDEADALFGKRSEVRDSHDRYANMDIAFLLQKMEEYTGISILATNLKQNLDEALTRRLAFTVFFPFPDEKSRRKIWSVVWPREVPIDASVDFDYLSREFTLAGGNIRNIAIAAAFLAAEDGTPVVMAHLVRATRREFQKMGKTLDDLAYRLPADAKVACM